ncbi:anoctamin-4-like isoform X5 [Ptychodera flava]|uniref:anoctamin-4-like isoform X5 n=1 Tax=Ptychodera flava TaxID=63121 RepID=UPI003969C841
MSFGSNRVGAVTLTDAKRSSQVPLASHAAFGDFSDVDMANVTGFDNVQMQNLGGQNPPAIGLEAYGQPSPPPPNEQNLYPSINDNGSGAKTDAATGTATPIGLESQNEAESKKSQDPGSVQIALTPEEEEEIKEKQTLFFRDTKRRIDYVLAFEISEKDKDEEKDEGDMKKESRRKEFQHNLEVEHGLELEIEDASQSADKKTCFVKIHANWEVLTTAAETMKLKMPIQENDIEEDGTLTCCDKMPNPFALSEEYIKPEPNSFTCAFVKDRQEEFIGIENKDDFFSPAERSRMVYEILERCKYDPDKGNKFGIEHLLSNGTYTAAFPLHEGKYTSEHSMLTHGSENDRRLLYEEWARPGRWYKNQPLDLVRKYYGEKIGLYFAWLGYYTSALIPAAIIGLGCFIYGCVVMFDNPVQKETCDEAGMGNATMCPLCNERCGYWLLYDSCIYTQMATIFDNQATVLFAVVMGLWATLFLEFWKRKQFEIQYDWDLFGFEDHEENCRPEFEANAPDKRVNPVTKEEQPYVNLRTRFPRLAAASIVILLMILLVLACVLGVVVYRIAVSAAIASTGDDFASTYSSLITTVTASCINLVLILILNRIYEKIAVWLTDLEMHRTETMWEDSFTFKMYLFSFVNYYTSIFYIAFLKGPKNGYPGDYDTIFGLRVEECDPGGCLPELCLQLAIIMVGKQAYNNALEIILPKLLNWWSSRDAKQKEKQLGNEYTRWEQDYDLRPPDRHGLFSEYLEMVLQFGFVTLFVAAFSLAPLFALLNNIIEIRLDAYKFTSQMRRPMAARAQDIGIWYGILDGVGKIAVVTNALVIALTSEFIPRLVYIYQYSETGGLEGYVNNSLSYFNTSDFQEGTAPNDPSWPQTETGVVDICRYKDYRLPPWSGNPYGHSIQYWHVLAAKLAFVIVFEHVVFLSKWLIDYLIPDVPQKVRDEIRRENYLARQALYRAALVKKTNQEKES